MLRKVKPEDAPAIAEIYNYFILHSIATFEETVVDAEEILERIRSTSAKYPWLIYEHKGQVIGYAYASEWKSRPSYKYSVESTVYLRQGKFKKGVGSMLYAELIKQLIDMEFHAIIGGICFRK